RLPLPSPCPPGTLRGRSVSAVGFLPGSAPVERIPAMLVLSRRIDEKIVFPTFDTILHIVAIKNGAVRLGIEAPDDVPVYREEIFDPTRFTPPPTRAGVAEAAFQELTHLVRNRLNSTTIGFALLRRQLELGLHKEVEGTLQKIEQEIEVLRGQV